ncbi:MAG: two-component system response regulator CreB [Gammaproteobacteria bacterium]|nr:two-component system response regulator CreB [Gammaproteobacteria bacterium]
MTKLLLVEDEAAIADTVVYALEESRFSVKWCQLGREALHYLQNSGDVALVILDVGLPDGSGFDVCKAIRHFSEVPIIFLTARGEELDRVIGLEIGGDDYVTKPFSPRELVSRVKVILKRVLPQSEPAPGSNTISAPLTEFTIDEQRACILLQGHSLELTRYEFLILQLLLSQPERVFTRDQIMNAVWVQPETSLDRAVDSHIKSLRSKLRQVQPNREYIKTHRGLGYSIGNYRRES